MKNILITGASGGLGTYLLDKYLEEGYTVYAIDLKQSNDIKNDNYCFFEMDISNEQSWKDLLAELKNSDVQLDALVNAAGILRLNKIEDTPLDEWNQVMNVNVTGTFLALKYLSSRLGQGSSVVNISSIASFLGSRDRISYAASKGAVAALTKAIAIEWAPRGIRANSVHPAYIKTGMAKLAGEYTERSYEEMGARIPLYNRISTPEDVGGVVLFLTSEASKFITGSELVCDGGQSVN